MRYLEDSLADLLGVFPDIQIATSAVVVIAVICWLFAAMRREDVKVTVKPKRAREGRRSTTMTKPTQSHSEGQQATPAGFTIKWGRTAIFGVSALAFLTAIITTITALFGLNTGFFALMCLLVTVAGLATLRALAIHDQNKKVERSEEQQPETDTVVTPRRHEETKLFDNPEAQVSETSEQEELMPAEVAEQEPAPTVKKSRRIQRVPAPTYLQLDEVKRPEPKAFESKETPKPSSDVKLKDGVSEEFKSELKAKAHTRLDLDKVLRNRRQAM